MLDFKPSMMHFLFTLRLRKAMPIINLKEHYPTAHPKDFFVEVSDEVHALLKKGSVQHLKVGRSYRIPKAHLLTYLIGFAPGHTIRA